MTTRRLTALLVLFSAVFGLAVVAAFGSGSASAGAGDRAKGAVAVPADALAYASVSLDRGGAPFRALEGLAAKVDGGDAAVKQLDAMLGGSSQQAEMVRALGGDVSVGLVGVDLASAASGGMPQASAVIVATAADGATLPGVLQKAGFAAGPALDGHPVWERDAMAVTVDGSTAIGATSRATLADALAVQAGQQPALADDPAFQATIAKLPGNALAVAYLAPARFAGLLQAAGGLLPKQALPKGAPDPTQALAQLGRDLADVRGLGIAVTAESGGLRVVAAGDADKAALERLGTRFPTAYAPGIVDRVPADALGFAAFRDLGPTLLAGVRAAQAQDPQVADLVAAVEKQTGVTIDGLAGALGGEHAVYAVGGARPGATLLTQPQDASGANMQLSNALAAARDLAKGLPMGGEKGAKRPDLGAIGLEQDGGTLAIGTLPGAAKAPAASIARSEAYQALRARAGVPDQVTGLAYVDAAQLRAQAAARGAAIMPAAKAVGGAIAWGTDSGAELFIAIG